MGNQFHSKYLFHPTLPLFVKYVDMINIDNLARYFNINYVHIYLIERVTILLHSVSFFILGIKPYL